jgi:hypothetical protein
VLASEGAQSPLKASKSFLGWLSRSSLLVVFLGGAFLLSCVFLVVQLRSPEKPDYTVIAELLLVAVLSLEGIVAVRHLRQSRLESVHTVLVDVLHDYRTPEMFVALNALWSFHREHGDQFVQQYLHRWQQDDARIRELPSEQQLEATKCTLHYRRRLVKEFYNLLAGLYDIGVFPPEVLYTYWNETELRIITKILIPIETAVATELRKEKAPGEWLQRLKRLHDDCPR